MDQELVGSNLCMSSWHLMGTQDLTILYGPNKNLGIVNYTDSGKSARPREPLKLNMYLCLMRQRGSLAQSAGVYVSRSWS